MYLPCKLNLLYSRKVFTEKCNKSNKKWPLPFDYFLSGLLFKYEAWYLIHFASYIYSIFLYLWTSIGNLSNQFTKEIVFALSYHHFEEDLKKKFMKVSSGFHYYCMINVERCVLIALGHTQIQPPWSTIEMPKRKGWLITLRPRNGTCLSSSTTAKEAIGSCMWSAKSWRICMQGVPTR